MSGPIEPESGVPGSADALRHAMSHFSSGVTVLTTLAGEVQHAMTATAITAVSLEPPLVLACVSRTSRIHAALVEADTWCISLLAAGQQPIARHFADHSRDVATQFDSVDWWPSPIGGVPLIGGALGWLECETYAAYDGGDHTILVGRLLRASRLPDVEETTVARPLTYYRGSYS